MCIFLNTFLTCFYIFMRLGLFHPPQFLHWPCNYSLSFVGSMWCHLKVTAFSFLTGSIWTLLILIIPSWAIQAESEDKVLLIYHRSSLLVILTSFSKDQCISLFRHAQLANSIWWHIKQNFFIKKNLSPKISPRFYVKLRYLEG